MKPTAKSQDPETHIMKCFINRCNSMNNEWDNTMNNSMNNYISIKSFTGLRLKLLTRGVYKNASRCVFIHDAYRPYNDIIECW